MNTTHWLQTRYLPISLIALMALTRFHHWGDALHLPDASLAVFFFAGFYRRTALFPLLLLTAGLIDYLAVAGGGTSSYCISPAYVFLIPTYAAMWWAGRYCTRFNAFGGNEWLRPLGCFMLAVTAAFIISNGSFYLFSDRYADIDWGRYIEATAGYYLPYSGYALGYAAAIYAAVKLIRELGSVPSQEKRV